MTFGKSFFARRLLVPSGWIGEKSNFEAAGESGEIYWIPDRMMNAPAKTTVFNNIRLSESLYQDFPQEVVEYIFLHERGHADRNRINQVLFAGISVLSFFLFGVFLTFTIIFAVLASTNLTLPIFGVVIFFFGLSALLGWFYCRVQMNEELRAERYALDKLGEEEFRRRHKMWENLVNRDMFSRLQRQLFYPEIETVISTYRASIEE